MSATVRVHGAASDTDERERTDVSAGDVDDLAAGVLVVRRGPGANCSSIGSAVEMLFLSATVGAAVLGAIVAALRPPPAEPATTPPGEPPASATVRGAAGPSDDPTERG